MTIGQNSKTHESFLILYKELYEHTPFLEECVVRMVHGRKVDKAQLESHLAQMTAAIATSHKKSGLLTVLRTPRGAGKDLFRRDLVRATRVSRDQVTILLKTSFLVERTHPGMDYIKTLSDLITNIHGAFQHVVRSNVLMPLMMN